MQGDTRRGSWGFCRARAAPTRCGKNRSESSVGSRKKIFTAGTEIVGRDGASHTSDDSPRRRREVVNLDTWPMCAKIAEIILRGEREPTQIRALGVGYKPPQTNTGDWRGTGAKPAGPDGEDTVIVDGDEAARSCAVVFRGRLWQPGQEIGISVGAALAVLEGVVERRENLEPPLNWLIVIPTLPMFSSAL